jgi:hypothetical protein
MSQSNRLSVDYLGNVVMPARGGVFFGPGLQQLADKIAKRDEKKRELLNLFRWTWTIYAMDLVADWESRQYEELHQSVDPETMMNPVSDTWFDNETPYSGESDKNDTLHYGDEASRYLSFDGYDGEIDPDMAFYQADNDHHRGLRLARKDRKRPLNPAIFH